MESGRRDSEDTTSDSPTVGGMAESTRGMVAMAMGGGMVADMVASLAVAITIEADTDRGPASRPTGPDSRNGASRAPDAAVRARSVGRPEITSSEHHAPRPQPPHIDAVSRDVPERSGRVLFGK
jgi:hypothetical protein